MIEFLRLRNVGVIESAEFEVGTGLTVLTGETGAGKTMVLTAVNLLLGAKMPSGLATGADTAVQGEWRVEPDSALARQLNDAGVDVSAGELLLTRTLPKEGRSRISANGIVVPQTSLSQWADDMVAVHGQSEQILLRRASRQRDVLDQFAGRKHQLLREKYRAQYETVLDLNEQWRTAHDSRDALEREVAELSDGLTLIDKVSPLPNEDVELAEKSARLTNLSVLQNAAAGALAQLEGDDDARIGAIGLIHESRRTIDAGASLDERLREISQQLAGAAITISEATSELSSYLIDLDASPDELESIQSRRATLGDLTRRFGPDVADVLSWAESARQRLATLAEVNDLSKLAAKRDAARTELGALAGALSDSREAAAKRFVRLVSDELKGLAMPTAGLEITIRSHPVADGPDAIPLPSGDFVAFGASGVDEVEFLLRAHQGATAAPIAKAASGGELSRIMLALEVVLSDAVTAPTMIFDEVDAGVGGKAAIEIGRRLQQLGRKTQVLVVTHLPQVAAFADHHLTVTKSFDGTVTTSDVAVLVGPERVRELARMLAGQEDSQHAVAHAQELLDLAAEE